MNKQIKAIVDKYNLTIESEFIPWSRSRNAGEKFPSLNWKVTLKQAGRKILTTDYMAGCGPAPSYKQSFKRDWNNEQLVKQECETGFQCKPTGALGIYPIKSKPILPNIYDVIDSLLTDSDVLDYACFEDWAESFGYDADSRSHEKLYNACLKIALQLRTIGESTLAELREAYQDY